jgi:hypothetical protein
MLALFCLISVGAMAALRIAMTLGLKVKGARSDLRRSQRSLLVPIEPGPHGPPKGWWTVKRNGIPVRHFPGKEKAQRYATDPEYRARLVAGKAWEKAKGK